MPNKTSEHGGYISEGSISSGTHRQQDLLRAFSSEIERISPFNTIALVEAGRTCADCLDHDEPSAQDRAEADEIIEELTERLEQYAAAEGRGLYFGTSEGDGSDFGFWQLPTDEDSDEDSE